MLMLISIFFALPGGPEVSSYRIINVSYYNVIKSVDLVRFFFVESKCQDANIISRVALDMDMYMNMFTCGYQT